MENQQKVITGKVVNMWDHKGWGNNISWFDWDKRMIVGHLITIPKVGDELRANLQSGKVGRFLITVVEPCRDPRDMFFATVSDIGYLDD